MEYGKNDSSFIAAGGKEGLFNLAKEFYSQMQTLHEVKKIRQMHPHDLNASIEKLALFLCGWLGGPKYYQKKFGTINIPKAHAHLAISLEEKDMWLLCMKEALKKSSYPLDFQKYLLSQLAIPAMRCVNN